MRQARQAAAKYHHVGIDDVDHVRQPAREAARVPVQRRLGRGVAAASPGRDLLACEAEPGRACVVGLQARPRYPGLQATMAPAPALGTWTLVVPGPGQRIVAPFATDPERSVDRASMQHEPAAAAGAENDAEHRGRAGPCAV